MRFLIRRLKRLMPQAQFLAGFWMLGEGHDKAEEWRKAVGADFVATSLTQATAVVVREASVVPRPNVAGHRPREIAMTRGSAAL